MGAGRNLVFTLARQQRCARDSSGSAAGPDGALWFTETSGNRIGRVTTAGAISEFVLGPYGGDSGPVNVTAGRHVFRIGPARAQNEIWGSCANASGQQRRTGRQRLAHELGDGA